jgi:hypothetical protein
MSSQGLQEVPDHSVDLVLPLKNLELFDVVLRHVKPRPLIPPLFLSFPALLKQSLSPFVLAGILAVFITSITRGDL